MTKIIDMDHQPQQKKQPNKGKVLLTLVMFLLGACGLAYEYTLSKIAADLLGNSVQQWATMIAVILFAMGLGAEIQTNIPTAEISDKLIFSQVTLALVGGFAPMCMLYGFSMMGDYYIIVQYGLALGVGTLIGFEIPLIMRINEERDPEMKINLARILKMDYIGALVGALVWTFVFVRYLSLSHVSFILGYVSLISSILIFFLYRQHLLKPRSRIAEISLCATALTIGFYFSQPLMRHAEQYLYRDKIVFTATTPYQHIVLTENSKSNINCYINGHLQFSESDEAIYHENLVHPAMLLCPQAKRVLILGGGDGLAAREVLKYPTVKEIVLVDIDPQMTRLAKTQPDLVRLNRGALLNDRLKFTFPKGVTKGEISTLTSPNQRQRKYIRDHHAVAQVRVVNLDAASFLRNASGVFDVVILDFPDPSSPDLAKLYSKPFYMSLKNHLKPSSVIVQQSGSPFHAKEAFLCIGRTLNSAGFSVLPYHDNVPSFGEWGWWLGRVISPNHQEKLKSQISALTENDFQSNSKYLSVDLIKSSLIFGRNQLISQHSDITSLTESKVYYYYLQGWN